MADTKEDRQNQKKLYELYQLDWMMSHGYSLADLMRGMTEIPWYHDDYISDYYVDEDSAEPEGMKADIEGIFKAWEFDSDAFGGECWTCFKEFLSAEFLMIYYIDELIKYAGDPDTRDKLWKWYSDYRKRNQNLDWE